MAQITFKGLCSGTVQKHSEKKGTDYKVTTFVEVPSLKTFDVFGDLGLSAHDDIRDYVLDANVVNLGNVTVKAGGVAQKNNPSKS